MQTQKRAPPRHDGRGRFASPRPAGRSKSAGRSADLEDPSHGEALQARFPLYLRTHAYSAETVRTYLANLRLFARWAVGHHVPLVRASRNAVALYLDEQLRAVRQVTARHRLCSLRAFFRFCQAQGWRRDDPTQGIRIKQPKVQAQRPFTADEVRALLSACCNSRDRAIVLVLTATGIRVSELLGMTAADIDWERGMVLIRGKGSKERWVALGGIALEALREQANGEHGAIWRTVEGNPMPRVLVRDALYALSRRSGVAHVHAHRLRTTFANAWLMEGGDLQALQVLMGHSTIAQTAHYAAYSAASRALEAQRGFAFVDRLSGGDLKVLEAESAARWRCSICGGSERHAPGGCPAVPEEVRRLWASMGGQAKAQKTEASPC